MFNQLLNNKYFKNISDTKIEIPLEKIEETKKWDKIDFYNFFLGENK